MTKIQLGSLKLDPAEYGSQGNAILGIRDSGKSYTATYLAERLFEADIPFVAFDPIGIWRFLRVPSRGGRGYPVVVAGGKEGDLPLTETGAPEIVRAAMRTGVSLVIDLFDIKLTKSAWRRIVTQCVRVLLHENQSHGLRHVFIEEAAEFIPQKPIDWDVYNELEKLARMGGNSRLGYTLINQRSQEVSKAILELCENIFLHRQRGKNALENLDKWLAVAGADAKQIVASLPELPQGKCWGWIGGDKPRPPTLIQVPRKNSLHPDRRVMRGDITAKPRNAVDVGKFVTGMKTTLVKVEEEAKANDPALLRKQLADLQAQLKKATPAVAVSASKRELAAEFQRGFGEGELVGFNTAKDSVETVFQAFVQRGLKAQRAVTQILETAKLEIPTKFKRSPPPAPPTSKAIQPGVKPPSQPVSAVAVSADGTMTKTMLETLGALAWWAAVGKPQPDRKQLAGMLGIVADGSTMRSRLAALSNHGLIRYPKDGLVALTDEGAAIAPAPNLHATLIETLRASFTATERRTFDAIPGPGAEISREDLAALLGKDKPIEPNGSTMRSRLAALSTRDIITYPQNGFVTRQDWVIG